MSSRDDIANALDTIAAIAKAVGADIVWEWEKYQGRVEIWTKYPDVEIQCYEDWDVLPVRVDGHTHLGTGAFGTPVRWRGELTGVRWIKGRVHAKYEIEVIDDGH